MRAFATAHRWRWSGILAAAAAIAVVACQDSSKSPTGERELSRGRLASRGVRTQSAPVVVEVFAPDEGDPAGVDGIGWFIDLAVEFPNGIEATGFTGNQLTGPGVHENAAPFPGTFTPGKDEKFQGLIVLLSTNTLGAGSCQNLSNLFNLTGPTYVEEDETEIWDTWIITTADFGHDTPSTLWVAEARDLDGDGVYNDAPNVVPDANGDGKCNEADLKAVGLASAVAEKHFFIN
ncbi:MAG: hypothetical protein ABI836_08305 [Gemmatimonadota bacterium]